jgi:hypothetical protein
MNANSKRGRGRPRGSGLNDTGTLMQIADMMARIPRLRPTTALRRIDPDVNQATVRRIQAKWREQGSRLLAEALARLRSRTQGTASSRPKVNRGFDYARRLFNEGLGVNAPAPLTVTQLAAAEVARRAQEIVAMATVRTSMMSSAMLTARYFADSPTMRAIREFHDNPTMRAIREFHDNPTMRAIREAQATLGIRG